MLFIDKQEEPPELKELRENAINDGLTPKEAYSRLCNPLKRKVIDALMHEQGKLCAYCACELPDNRVKSDDIAKVTIEHWYPVSINNIPGKAHGLDYKNMMAVCAGNQGPRNTRRRGDLTCDSKRENRLLKVNPLDAKTLKYVSYTSNGVIYSKDEVIQNDLDVKLNLNCKSAGIDLPLQRKKVLDVIQSQVYEAPNDVILCNKILKSIKIQPVPYSDAAIWWLEGYIRKLQKISK